jgi:hypothetical protein
MRARRPEENGLAIRRLKPTLRMDMAKSLNDLLFSKIVDIALLALLPFFTCSFADSQTPHVHLEAGSTRTGTLEATCSEKKCILQMRSLVLKVEAPSGKSSEFVVHMLRDPRTKLFGYQYFQTYQGFDLDRDRKMFASSVFVYVGPHQLVIFKSYFGPEAAAWKGTETYSSMDGGQASVLRFFEAHRATAETELQAHANKIELMKKIPRQFMEQCYSAMATLPTIENLKREGDIWKFTLKGPNGNSAEVSVDDSFTVVSTKLMPRPDVIVLDSASLPARAFHEGTPAQLQAHEIRLRIANGCYLDSVMTVLTIFDPETKLFQWFSGGDDFPPPKDRLPNEWANKFLQDSIFAIAEGKIVDFSPKSQTVQESSSRFPSMQEAEQSLFSQIAKHSKTWPGVRGLSLNFAVFSGSASCDSPTWRSPTREAGRWRLQVSWRKGLCKDAAVFLDDNYNLLSADLAYASTPPEPYGSKSNPLLMSLLHAAKGDPLRLFPQSELKMTDKSSSIHALKNGRSVAVTAYLVEIGRTDYLPHPLIGKMLAIYDSTSRLFWCLFEPGEWSGNIEFYSSKFEKGESWLVITDDKIVGFDGISNNNFMGVQESDLRYDSFSEGLNRALAVIWQNVGLVRDGHRVFDIPLPEAFLVPDRTKPRLIPHYAGISQQGHNWQLVFEQSEGQRAVVTLSEQYEPIGANVTFVGSEHK